MPIEEGSFIQEVRNSVEADHIYFDEDERDQLREDSLTEWLRLIADNSLESDQQDFRMIAWFRTLHMLPFPMGVNQKEFQNYLSTAYSLTHAAAYKRMGLHTDMVEERLPGERPSQMIHKVLKKVAEDILSKQNKILRLLNWLYLLKASPPKLAIYQEIADHCGLTRQAVHKDSNEIREHFPELSPLLRDAEESVHRHVNRSNAKLS